VDARQGRIKLDLNGVSLWADPAQLAEPSTPPTLDDGGGKSGVLSAFAAGSARTGRTAGKNTESPLLSLDLRGKRADLADGELTRFLDDALLAGRESVEIVHGRGTGALRKHVHAVLRTFPGIASYALAPEDRGGDGMTIVTFR